MINYAKEFFSMMKKIVPLIMKLFISRWWKHVASVFVMFTFYLVFVVHIEPYQMGVSWNPFTGDMDTVQPGIHFMSPLKMVSVVDLRPVRVGITSTARISNYKLVQFDKRGWRKFVQMQGFGYWWWNNRFSFNSGYSEEYRGMKDILRGYAYGDRRYSFIIFLDSSYYRN